MKFPDSNSEEYSVNTGGCGGRQCGGLNKNGTHEFIDLMLSQQGVVLFKRIEVWPCWMKYHCWCPSKLQNPSPDPSGPLFLLFVDPVVKPSATSLAP